ncbi:MAG: hypothetical protein K2X01_10770 [Cyanobacteria bacterium]|nr:hypothetical protein [Cyanobacteriota bacterium]
MSNLTNIKMKNLAVLDYQTTDEAVENFRVVPSVRLLNKYVQRAKKVAISSINPFFFEDSDGHTQRGLNIRVEGPASHISYFNRLIDQANLKIS